MLSSKRYVIHIVLNSLGRGGAERSVLQLLQELLRRGIEAEIICLFADSNTYEVDDTILAHIKFLNAPSYIAAQWRLLLYLAQHRDGLVFSLMPQSNIAAVWIGKLLGIRVITSERTTPRLFYRSPTKLMLALLPHAFSSRAVFISRFALRFGLPDNWLGRIVSQNAVVVHNPVVVSVGLDQAIHDRAKRIEHLSTFITGTNIAPFKILLASRLVEGKGILEFIQSAADFIGRANVCVDIAGTGPLELTIRSVATRLGIADKLIFHGFINDIQAAYARADLVVLSSEAEGFGRVGFEAYIQGCLVIGTHRNSFWDEIVEQAPAWARLGDMSSIETGLKQLHSSIVGHEFVENGRDIDMMRTALSVPNHAKQFLNSIGWAADAECVASEATSGQ